MKSMYVIYRHGSNKANQTMTPVAAVGVEEAESIEEAKAQAAVRINCYANQFLEARCLDECSMDDRIAADEAEMAREAEESFYG